MKCVFLCVSARLSGREKLTWTVPVEACCPPGFLCSDGYWCPPSPRDRCSVISRTKTHTHAHTQTHTILKDSNLPPRYLFFRDTHTPFKYAPHTHRHADAHTHTQWLVRFSQYSSVASIIAQHNDNKVMPRGDLHFVKTATIMLPPLLLLPGIYASLSGCSFLTFSAQSVAGNLCSTTINSYFLCVAMFLLWM